jgi:hypothetical protein
VTDVIPSQAKEPRAVAIDAPDQIGEESALEVTAEPASEVPGVLILGNDGRIVSATANVDGYFHDLGALDSRWREGHELPLAVQAVLSALERGRPRPDEQEHRMPRVRTRALSGRWLVLHAAETAATDSRPGERVVVVTPAQDDGAWFAVVGYELGSRTAEAVRSLVRGLSTMRSSSGRLLAVGMRLLGAPLAQHPGRCAVACVR